jgi:hypothetical protein
MTLGFIFLSEEHATLLTHVLTDEAEFEHTASSAEELIKRRTSTKILQY